MVSEVMLEMAIGTKSKKTKTATRSRLVSEENLGESTIESWGFMGFTGIYRDL